VREIVFAKGDNPNHGNLPKYVVVEFPAYSGPKWDSDNPKVSIRLLYTKVSVLI
jgi:hypothetical protein